MKERRQFPRASQPFTVQCRNYGLVGESWQLVQSVNLGAGGMRFISQQLHEVGSLLELRLQLPNAEAPLALRARLAWTKTMASGLIANGVEFMDTTPEQRAQVDALVEFLGQAA